MIGPDKRLREVARQQTFRQRLREKRPESWIPALDGCGGLQPSELFSAAFLRETDPTRSLGSVRGQRS
jgi:hypothetical protein